LSSSAGAFLGLLLLFQTFPGPAAAREQAPSPAVGSERARRIPKDRRRWAFRKGRRVEAVVLGGSIAAYGRGGFPDVLQAVCPELEVVNLAWPHWGAGRIRRRFERAVLRNRELSVTPPNAERWVILHGGVNSAGSPPTVRKHFGAIIDKAHAASWKVLGLTLSPWGDDQDPRWRSLAGVRMLRNTQQIVDFVLGSDRGSRAPQRLADHTVDLFRSPLRDRDARPRPLPPLRRALRRSSRVRKELSGLPAEARASRREELLAEASLVPTYYLRPELHSFDSLHPNGAGHRIIAKLVCPHVPSAAACRCDAIERLRWSEAAGGLVEGERPKSR